VTHAPDPDDHGPRRRGLGAAFWSMIVFGLLCILAGVLVSRFGPTWFPPKPAPVHAGATWHSSPAPLHRPPASKTPGPP
jgi:hypothetical protein